MIQMGSKGEWCSLVHHRTFGTFGRMFKSSFAHLPWQWIGDHARLLCVTRKGSRFDSGLRRRMTRTEVDLDIGGSIALEGIWDEHCHFCYKGTRSFWSPAGRDIWLCEDCKYYWPLTAPRAVFNRLLVRIGFKRVYPKCRY